MHMRHPLATRLTRTGRQTKIPIDIAHAPYLERQMAHLLATREIDDLAVYETGGSVMSV